MKIKDIKNPEDFLFLVLLRPLRKILFLTYTSSDDKRIELPAVIDEKRYKIKDGYKITLVSMVEGFASETFYQCDLEVIIRNGQVKVYMQVSM